MKRICALLLTLLFAFTLSSCGSGISGQLYQGVKLGMKEDDFLKKFEDKDKYEITGGHNYYDGYIHYNLTSYKDEFNYFGYSTNHIEVTIDDPEKGEITEIQVFNIPLGVTDDPIEFETKILKQLEKEGKVIQEEVSMNDEWDEFVYSMKNDESRIYFEIDKDLPGKFSVALFSPEAYDRG